MPPCWTVRQTVTIGRDGEPERLGSAPSNRSAHPFRISFRTRQKPFEAATWQEGDSKPGAVALKISKAETVLR